MVESTMNLKNFNNNTIIPDYTAKIIGLASRLTVKYKADLTMVSPSGYAVYRQ